MSILTAIIQAVLQALSWILPISEYGHSSLFHDFAGRATGSCSAITGVIHIGIAIGILISSYKLFLTLSKEFFGTFKDLFRKQIKGSSKSPARSFMYMTLISFVPMILWLIPTGKNGFLFALLRKTGFNGTLLDDGIFFAITGLLVLAAAKQLSLARNNKNVSVLFAVVVGVLSIFLVPVSGLSLTAGIFAVLMLLGVSKKLSFRYSIVMSVPVLIVMGIAQICTAVISAGAVEIILGVIISAAVSFIAVKLLQWIINANKLKFFGIYDIGIGVIAIIIGIFELILK
ncbi:MAG: undecaprenyl-diphosphate phosphatase [Eubacterium sp.]